MVTVTDERLREYLRWVDDEPNSAMDDVDDLGLALRELLALREQNRWTEIVRFDPTTYPEYGSVVQVYCYTDGDESKLRFQDLAGYSYHGGFAVGCLEHDRSAVVTHWRPLPAGPDDFPLPSKEVE